MPTTVHEYVYDDAGRMVETIVHTDTEWDADEVDLMLALDLIERDIDPHHGHPTSESVGKQANPDSPEATHTYVAEAPVTDWAAYAQQAAYGEYRAALEAAGLEREDIDLQMRATHISVRRVDRDLD